MLADRSGELQVVAFAPEAFDDGLHAAWAIPMRLRTATIGSLNLLRSEPGPLSEADLTAAQALADVATVGLIQQRAAEDARILSDQLQTALDSRVVIEQANDFARAEAAIKGGAQMATKDFPVLDPHFGASEVRCDGPLRSGDRAAAVSVDGHPNSKFLNRRR